LANTSGVNLNLNGNNDTIGSLEGGGTSGGNVVLGSGNLTINQIYRYGATVADQNTTYTGVISGTGSVTKKGYGVITFTAANTYTGGTVINAGAIQIDVNNGLAANRAISITNTGILYILKNRTITTSALAISENAKLWIQSGATVNIDQASNTEMAGIIFGHGAGENKGKLRKTGSGTFNITGSNNITVENY
jgi:fibronectin-binding autotransporter adhesin